MRTKRCLYCALAIAMASVAGCQTKSFEHGGDLLNGSSGGQSFSGVGGDAVSGGDEFPNFDGNYPEPAVSRCGDVLGGLPPLPGLASAWAIVAVPGATMNGEPVEAGSVMLRISERVITECGDAPNPNHSFGSTGFGGESTFAGGLSSATGDRGFEMMLGPDELALGIHDVATLTGPRVGVFGEGSTSESGAGANIELLRVDDDCVIGIARGFLSDTGEPFMYGGFVAQTCQRQCIASEGSPC